MFLFWFKDPSPRWRRKNKLFGSRCCPAVSRSQYLPLWQTTLRFEDNKLLLFVRNNSDDSLDLTAAKIDIDDPELLQSPMGAYPDVSKVYDVSTTAGSAKLETDNDRLVVKLHITQAIPPKAADQFGVQIVGPAGPLDLSNVKFDVEIQDIKGHTYVVRH